MSPRAWVYGAGFGLLAWAVIVGVIATLAANPALGWMFIGAVVCIVLTLAFHPPTSRSARTGER